MSKKKTLPMRLDSSASAETLAAMRDRSIERQDRWDTEVVEIMPTREQIQFQHIEGTLSKVVLPHGIAKGKRYVLKRALVDLGEGIKEIPTTAARDYLSVRGFESIHPRGKMKDRLNETMKLVPALPGLAIPGESDEGFYIDIRRCFLAVMCMAGWNVGYDPGKHVLKGIPPLDFPLMDNSVARNSLVSLAANHTLYVVTPPQWIHKPMSTFNGLYNTSINSLIRDTLHTIAGLAQKEGALYVATDGFIAPTYKSARQIGDIIEDFGLAFSIKARGKTVVRGSGSYKVGDKKSLLFDRRAHNPTQVRGIREVEYRRWLQAEMSNLAATDGALHLVSDKL